MIPYNRYSEQTWETSFNLYNSSRFSTGTAINSLKDFKRYIFNATFDDLSNLKTSLILSGKYSIIVNDCVEENQEIALTELDSSIPPELYSEARQFFINHFENNRTELPIIQTLLKLNPIHIQSYNYNSFENFIADLKAAYNKHKYVIDAFCPSVESLPFQNKNQKTSNYFALKH